MLTEPVVQARHVSKSFGGTRVLNGVNLEIRRGEMVGLIGASGSGKSTLIRTIAGLTPIDRRHHGRGVSRRRNPPVLAVRCSTRPDRATGQCAAGARWRHLSAIQSGAAAVGADQCLLRSARPDADAARHARPVQRSPTRPRAMQALARVGIAEHALKRGSELSGGQQQRAAIARTLVQGAEFIVADEPIASLDPNSARRVMDLLADMNRNDGLTVFISLHQVEYAMKYCPRTIALQGGKVAYDGPSSALTPAFLNEIYGAESEELFCVVRTASAGGTCRDASARPVTGGLHAARRLRTRRPHSDRRIGRRPKRD